MRARIVGPLAALVLLPAGTAVAQSGDHGGGHHDPAALLRVGNAQPYPDLAAATRANRRRAHRLRRATVRGSKRLDTLRKARRQGYVMMDGFSLPRPGLRHFRKHGFRFWGGVLDARQPQALVFWCPTVGKCRLAAYMYRAPWTPKPPTFGGLLGWHAHREGASWMTHIWLAGRTAAALAQCAPFNALRARDPMLVWEPYAAERGITDEPCPDTDGLGGAPHAMGSNG